MEDYEKNCKFIFYICKDIHVDKADTMENGRDNILIHLLEIGPRMLVKFSKGKVAWSQFHFP